MLEELLEQFATLMENDLLSKRGIGRDWSCFLHPRTARQIGAVIVPEVDAGAEDFQQRLQQAIGRKTYISDIVPDGSIFFIPPLKWDWKKTLVLDSKMELPTFDSMSEVWRNIGFRMHYAFERMGSVAIDVAPAIETEAQRRKRIERDLGYRVPDWVWQTWEYQRQTFGSGNGRLP